MKYALNLASDGRVLSVTFEKYAPRDAVLVDVLPDRDVSQYRYADGILVYDPSAAAEELPSWQDRMEAQLAYTAMMTDTLLEA